jgi:hypothetical protein
MFETTKQGNYGKAVYYCLPNPNPIWISTFRKCSLEFRDMMQNDAQLKGHLSRREERPFHPFAWNVLVCWSEIQRPWRQVCAPAQYPPVI